MPPDTQPRWDHVHASRAARAVHAVSRLGLAIQMTRPRHVKHAVPLISKPRHTSFYARQHYVQFIGPGSGTRPPPGGQSQCCAECRIGTAQIAVSVIKTPYPDPIGPRRCLSSTTHFQLISTRTKPRETSIVALLALNRRPSPHCLLAVAFTNNKTCSFAVYPYLRSQRLARLGLSSCPFVVITTHKIRAFYPYLRPTRHTRLGLSSCPSVAFVANEIGVDKVSRQLFTHAKSKQVHC